MKFPPVIAVSCFIFAASGAIAAPSIVVSIPDQKLVLVENGSSVAQFPVSTSKFGLGDRPNSYATPLGSLEVASKIGANAPLGTVFKSRRPTGEILRPNAAGRDPIVTRIIWLRGLEKQNARAYDRGIYIHGTPVEKLIGRPASYGCIRMRSQDVATLFSSIDIGTKITVSTSRIRAAVAQAAFKAGAGVLKLAAN